MIHGATLAGDRDQPGGTGGSGGAGNFQTDEAVMVGAAGELERTVALGLSLYSCHHVFWIGAPILRPTLERRDPGVAWRRALPFRRQSAVRRTGADDDPVVVVAAFGRHDEFAGKGRTRLKFDDVAAERIVQSGLQIATGIDGNNASPSWRGRRCGSYRRRKDRVNSFANRESSSVLIITHVSKHNEASESGFTTTPWALTPTAGLVRMATPTCSDTK